MAIKITSPQNGIVNGNVTVPLSKSESNRALLIKAIAGFDFSGDVLSGSDDTIALKNLLQSTSKTLDAKDGGTTARFLIAYCAVKKREAIITGSARLQQRPVDDIADVVRQLGCTINFLNKEGFLPIEIIPGKDYNGNQIICSSEKSSQHISALMMCAPLFKNDLTIKLTGSHSSFSYLNLTAAIMKQFGAEIIFEQDNIHIKAGNYTDAFFKAGGDWSAASYFYEIAALSNQAKFSVSGLDIKSSQGDLIIVSYAKLFGCRSKSLLNEIEISKTKPPLKKHFAFGFQNTPDIALTVAAICSGLNLTADLRGLKNLRLKESDRVSVFQREIYKLNIKTDFCDFSKLKIFDSGLIKSTARVLQTHSDHRMAMCLAPLALKTGFITLDDAAVVNKSFPDYFKNLELLGFTIETTS